MLNKFKEKKKKLINGDLNICSRCIYDETVPNISFDDQNICNYCHQIDDMQEIYKVGSIESKESLIIEIESHHIKINDYKVERYLFDSFFNCGIHLKCH